MSTARCNSRKNLHVLRRVVTDCAKFGENTSKEPDANWDLLGSLLLIGSLKCIESAGKLDFYCPDKLSIGAMISRLHDDVMNFCSPSLKSTLSSFLVPSISESTVNYIYKQFSSKTLEEVWQYSSNLGYIYQFYSIPARKKAQASIQTSNKQLTSQRLVRFTQLYTPDWVADFLLANTILPQWKKPNSKEFANTSFDNWLVQPNSYGNKEALQLNILDPACGSGHILARAFNMLVELHLAEGKDLPSAVQETITHNIAGTDIDETALFVCALTLITSCLSLEVKPSFTLSNLTSVIQTIDRETESFDLGSLDRTWSTVPNHPLANKYAAVVTNPPYIGRKLIGRNLRSKIKAEYPNAHHDLCSPFLIRGLEMLEQSGRLGFITQSSMLSLPSYSDLRRTIIDQHDLLAAIELGSGVFPLQGGDKVSSMLLLLESNKTGNTSLFIDLRSNTNKSLDLQKAIKELPDSPGENCYFHKPSNFLSTKHSAFNYSFPAALTSLIKTWKTLGEAANIRQGLATTDNKRFVRQWDEVEKNEIGEKWFPYVKGAGSERWFSPISHVVNWQNNGEEIKDAVQKKYPYLKGKTAWVVKNEEYYFRSGLCFSFINTGQLAVRRLPQGAIFDVAASALFANDPEQENFLLGYLNSSLIGAIAQSLNPTVNFQVGDIKRLPLPDFSSDVVSKISHLVNHCLHLKKEISSAISGGLDIVIPEELRRKDISDNQIDQLYNRLNLASQELLLTELEIDDLVFQSVFEKGGASEISASDQLAIKQWVDSQTKRIAIAISKEQITYQPAIAK
jgi:hypothetical protein